MTLLAGYVLSANVLAPRLVYLNLGVATPVLTTGSILWPFTAQISDMINEIYGRSRAYLAMGIAYVVNLLFVTFVYLGASATPLWDLQSEQFWASFFKPAPRLLLASLATAVVCQSVDILVFARLKRLVFEQERHAGTKALVAYALLRSIGSDVLNMALDGALFALLAFTFVLPPDTLVTLIAGSILVKSLLAVLDTPWFVAFRLSVRSVEREL
jgi:uncharacterized integral membrane protein (TIGR00697 family)